MLNYMQALSKAECNLVQSSNVDLSTGNGKLMFAIGLTQKVSNDELKTINTDTASVTKWNSVIAAITGAKTNITLTPNNKWHLTPGNYTLTKLRANVAIATAKLNTDKNTSDKDTNDGSAIVEAEQNVLSTGQQNTAQTLQALAQFNAFLKAFADDLK